MLSGGLFASVDVLAARQDTSEVLSYIRRGFEMRLTDAGQTIQLTDKALQLGKKLNFTKGIAEAYRVKGLGEHYLGDNEKAIENYLQALAIFQKVHNNIGVVRIYLNISSLYQELDYDKCIEYLQDAMKLYQSENLNNNNLLASIYLNLGNAYQLKHNFSKALFNYNRSYDIISKLDNPELKVTVLQNLGVIYYSTGNNDKAKEYLFKAINLARELDLNQPVAQINLTLSDIYIGEGSYNKAEKSLNEGRAYALLSKNDRLQKNFLNTFYQLEIKRRNYERALNYLQVIYKTDSTDYTSRNSAALNLYQIRYKQEELRRENERIIMQQRYDRNIMLATAALIVLLAIVVLLLTTNVRRKASTNKKLTGLNAEISKQKDNLDRINHHLEEIINERTKDLQFKNKKLSEYSSYLSHQIRGPIATLKGLMNLEQEGLLNQQECLNMMNKCVSDIDDKIMDMSDMLHNPDRTGM